MLTDGKARLMVLKETCYRYGLLYGFEYLLILSMFYD